MRISLLIESALVTILIFPGVSMASVSSEISVLHSGSIETPGIELRLEHSPYLATRYSLHDFVDGYRQSEIHYSLDSNIGLRGAAWYLDWHPFAGSFRLTSGIVLQSHSVDAEIAPTHVFDFAGSTIRGRDIAGFTIRGRDIINVSASASYLGVAPYFGIGWGGAYKKKRSVLTHSLDLGVMRHAGLSVESNIGGEVGRLLSENHREEFDLVNDLIEDEFVTVFEEIGDFLPYFSFGLSLAF
jgi:hypothetical protein